MDRIDLLLPRHHTVQVYGGTTKKSLLQLIIIRLVLACASRFAYRNGLLSRRLVLLRSRGWFSLDEFIPYLSDLLLVLIFQFLNSLIKSRPLAFDQLFDLHYFIFSNGKQVIQPPLLPFELRLFFLLQCIQLYYACILLFLLGCHVLYVYSQLILKCNVLSYITLQLLYHFLVLLRNKAVDRFRYRGSFFSSTGKLRGFSNSIVILIQIIEIFFI